MLTFKDLCIAALAFALIAVLVRLRKVSGQVHVSSPFLLGWEDGFISLEEAIAKMTAALERMTSQGLRLKRATMGNCAVSISADNEHDTEDTTITFVGQRKAAAKLARHLEDLLRSDAFRDFQR